ncbi:MAG TPA: biotin/lipoate A/B protein ligase family protein [Dehalococcoidia bacterium]|nr:biotin/lipoate A/B protein ligase family protein [Dehalococcoidia bacterium]
MAARATWRFIDSGPGPGSWQMALDEAMLAACDADRMPTLRLFAFGPDCLSLGRFQPALKDIDPAFCREMGLDVVRRPTGGRAVLHHGDLCYAVVAPVKTPIFAGPIRNSYCQIGAALDLALTKLGLSLESCASAADIHTQDATSCFAAAAPFESRVGSAKLVGSAQTRRGSAFLQQGSIRLHINVEAEISLLGYGEPSPTISQLLGRSVSYQEMATALQSAFEEHFAASLIAADLTSKEGELAKELERDKFSRLEWTWLR